MSLVYNYLHKIEPKRYHSEAHMLDLMAKIVTHIPTKSSMSEKQRQELANIYKCFQSIDKSLDILKKVGLDYSISLAGGAVREFILNRCDEINDYDIVLNIPSITYEWKEENKSASAHPAVASSANGLQPENSVKNLVKMPVVNETPKWKKVVLELTGIEALDISVELVAQTLYLLLTNAYREVKNFIKKDDITKDYLNDKIFNIFKVKNNALPRPVDIIFTEMRAQDFIGSFDFDICKALINYKKANTKQSLSGQTTENLMKVFMNTPELLKNHKASLALQSYQMSYLDLLDNIVLTGSFINDIENKTLSIHCSDGVSIEHLEYFFSKHYLKLKEKFPNYSINFYKVDIDNEQNYSANTANIKPEMRAWLIAKKLELELSGKSVNMQVFKI